MPAGTITAGFRYPASKGPVAKVDSRKFTERMIPMDWQIPENLCCQSGPGDVPLLFNALIYVNDATERNNISRIPAK
jgi:hypothetical protein